MKGQEAGQRQQPDRAEEQRGTQHRERAPAIVADRRDQEQARHDGYVHACTGEAALPQRGNGGQPGREIVRERGQFGIGQRDEGPGHPLVELVFGQPSLRECGLERVDRLLAVVT